MYYYNKAMAKMAKNEATLLEQAAEIANKDAEIADLRARLAAQQGQETSE